MHVHVHVPASSPPRRLSARSLCARSTLLSWMAPSSSSSTWATGLMPLPARLAGPGRVQWEGHVVVFGLADHRLRAPCPPPGPPPKPRTLRTTSLRFLLLPGGLCLFLLPKDGIDDVLSPWCHGLRQGTPGLFTECRNQRMHPPSGSGHTVRHGDGPGFCKMRSLPRPPVRKSGNRAAM